MFAAGKLRPPCRARARAAWKVPVEGLDPWKPESITDSSIAALKKWAGQKHECGGGRYAFAARCSDRAA